MYELRQSGDANSGWQQLYELDADRNMIRYTNIKKRSSNTRQVLILNNSSDQNKIDRVMDLLLGGEDNKEWTSELMKRMYGAVENV